MKVGIKRELNATSRSVPEFIDCDVHNALARPEDLLKYLPQRWHKHFDQLRGRAPRGGFYPSGPHNIGFRGDAKAPDGGATGSDFDLLREQLLDAWPVRGAILSPLEGLRWPTSGEFAGALVAALNDWMALEWLARDERLFGSIVIPVEDGARAAQEISRCSSNPRFVQVLMLARSREPLGSDIYWPIYEAATTYGLPIAVHVGGSGNPPTGGGWPSYDSEQHTALTWAMQAQVVSLVGTGTLSRFPKLNMVMEEGGFTWMGSLIRRMDRAWMQLGDQALNVEVAPSSQIRRHLWFTTQPMDDIDNEERFMRMLQDINMNDHIMFATDYPHWDFDGPDRAMPRAMGDELRRSIFRGNAESLFGLTGTK